MKLIEKNSKIKILLQKMRTQLFNEGFSYLRFLIRIITDYIVSFVKTPFFIFKNKKYPYFYHPYNHTWTNERAIEIPLIIEAISSPNCQILEIGNVLKHYVNLSHEVVDKYEKEKGVINEDVATYNSKKKYDLIISISTMEHVGLDEEVKQADKIPKSIENLKKLLKKEGKIIITVPINYNPWLDKLIEEGDLFDEIYFMKRKLFNQWRTSSWKEIKNCGFNEDARGLAIIVIKK